MTAKRLTSLPAGPRYAGLQRLLESFIMLDCRLGSHPRLSACLRLIAKDDLLMVAATNLRARDRILDLVARPGIVTRAAPPRAASTSRQGLRLGASTTASSC